MEKKNTTVEKVNPLRKEKLFVKFVPQKVGGAADDPRHVLYGGLADGATVTLCVPVLRSTGGYKNILTNEEKDFLERELGLDANGLSVYKKVDNYWDNYYVRIPKEGIHLDLSDPEDFIKWKVLCANSDVVAPDIQTLQDTPKQTYRFVIIRDNDEERLENARMDATMESYKQFGKIEDDIDTMRILVELIDAKPYNIHTTSEFLRSRINILIQSDPKNFLRQITDPMLHTKVILRRSVELGLVSMRNDLYYQKDGTPMCNQGENSTLSIAARYLNEPANQDLKFLLESKVDENRK